MKSFGSLWSMEAQAAFDADFWDKFVIGMKGTRWASYAYCVDDLLRAFLMTRKPGERLILYCKNKGHRKTVHTVAERYGLLHETQRSAKIPIPTMSDKELAAIGYIRRARNGCVGTCCGWEYVESIAPIMISIPVRFHNLNLQSCPTLRSLLGVRPRKPVANTSKRIKECKADLPVIPRDVLALIFQYCSVMDAVKGSLVCRHWSSLSRSVALWKYHYESMVDENENVEKFNHEKFDFENENEKCSERLRECGYERYKHEVLASQVRLCQLENTSCSGTVAHEHLI